MRLYVVRTYNKEKDLAIDFGVLAHEADQAIKLVKLHHPEVIHPDMHLHASLVNENGLDKIYKSNHPFYATDDRVYSYTQKIKRNNPSAKDAIVPIIVDINRYHPDPS